MIASSRITPVIGPAPHLKLILAGSISSLPQVEPGPFEPFKTGHTSFGQALVVVLATQRYSGHHINSDTFDGIRLRTLSGALVSLF